MESFDRTTAGKRSFRLMRRAETRPFYEVICRIVSVLLALLVAGVVIKLIGMPPILMLQKALKSTLGSSYGFEQALVLSTPLILCGLSVAIGLRMNIWNIGAEGQLFMGAWAATWVGLFVPGPTALILPLMFIAGALAGALWILIPALARAFLNVNEIITTLLLNFVAILFVNYFSIGPWRDSGVGILLATRRVESELPTFGNSYVHYGILIAVAIAVVLAFSIQRTRWGYEIRIIGRNRRTGRFAGMPVNRNILLVMLISGAIAGVAGMSELAGNVHRLSGTISNQYGYQGIIVAALSSGAPLVVLPVGFLLAILLNAGIVLQAQGISVNTMLAINGVILLFAAVGWVASQYHLVVTRDQPGDEMEEQGRGGSSREEQGVAGNGREEEV
ncbi:MAG: ABC transporter permease [Candidatus Auribacterota bacterium]|nr:ABC transporter permease [Candidatus Auribacterota bacterium]